MALERVDIVALPTVLPRIVRHLDGQTLCTLAHLHPVLYAALCRLLIRANDAFLSFLGMKDIACLSESLGGAVAQRLEKYKAEFWIPLPAYPCSITHHASAYMQHRYMRDLVVEYILHYLVPEDERLRYEAGHRTVVCTHYATMGDLDMLMLARRFGFPWDRTTTEGAVLHGCQECLEYAHNAGCDMTGTTLAAAQRGSALCLRYTYDATGYMEPGVLGILARSAFTETAMEFAHTALQKQGSPIDPDVCAPAVIGNCPTGLRFLVEHGYPVYPGAFDDAITYASVDCFKYLVEHVPHDKNKIEAALWAYERVGPSLAEGRKMHEILFSVR